MLQEQSLQSLTKQLLLLNEKSKDIFYTMKDRNEDGDFFKEVKPFADEVKQVADEWQKQALEWLKYNKVKNVYPLQIQNTHDNIQINVVKAHYIDTKQKRFLEMVQSIEFVLNALLNEQK
jgi:hypothetical protein